MYSLLPSNIFVLIFIMHTHRITDIKSAAKAWEIYDYDPTRLRKVATRSRV